MSQCQICSREIKDKMGVIAHHGYKRPSQGWQTQSCMGARNLSYEQSRDVIPKAIAYIKLFIENQKRIIENVKTNKIPVPSILGKSLIENTDKFYSIRQNEYLTKLDYEIKSAIREVERLQKRYDEWKLIEVTQ
ncbi:hypothetical protein M0R04_09660 [Candidatus Dojkabacteria bacterium]|jgi:hypothetical protein|nr:hypothetical protein [Candidatus Dojkabacteria bacterium]